MAAIRWRRANIHGKMTTNVTLAHSQTLYLSVAGLVFPGSQLRALSPWPAMAEGEKSKPIAVEVAHRVACKYSGLR